MTDLTAHLKLAKEAKERADEATPGPWFDVVIEKGGCGGWDLPQDATIPKAPTGALIQSGQHTPSEAVIQASNHDHSPWMLPEDREFVAHARADIPALANAVIELVAEVEVLKKERDDFKEMYELNIERPEQGL